MPVPEVQVQQGWLLWEVLAAILRLQSINFINDCILEEPEQQEGGSSAALKLKPPVPCKGEVFCITEVEENGSWTPPPYEFDYNQVEWCQREDGSIGCPFVSFLNGGDVSKVSHCCFGFARCAC
jgi:hypothetical protein